MMLALLIALSLGESVEPLTGKGVRPVLYGLPLTTGPNLPEAYGQAVALFDEASKDFEHERDAVAAPKFMKVAELLKAPKPETTYSESFAKMRGIAYQNASISYVAAGQRDARKKALTAALAKDPENKATLQKLLDAK